MEEKKEKCLIEGNYHQEQVITLDEKDFYFLRKRLLNRHTSDELISKRES